jgi:hypothetical protein
MKTIKEDLTDIVDLLRDGPVGQSRLWEQEINFDAGYTPPQTEWKIVKEEWIDGKKYNVYS